MQTIFVASESFRESGNSRFGEASNQISPVSGSNQDPDLAGLPC